MFISFNTGITDNTGVATVTVTCSADITLTATYSNVSSTCSVIYGSSYLFYDDCSINNTSQYGNYIVVRSPSSGSLAFNTDHYILSGSGSNSGGYAIPNVHQDYVSFRVKFKLTQGNAYNQFMLGVCDGTSYNNTKGIRVRGDKLFQKYNFTNGTESESTIYTHSTGYTDAYYYAEIIKQGTSLTMKLYNNALTQLASSTQTISSMSNPTFLFYGLTNRGTTYETYIQEILIDSAPL